MHHDVFLLVILRIKTTSFIDWRDDEGVDDVFILGSAHSAAKWTQILKICLEVFLQILL